MRKARPIVICVAASVCLVLYMFNFPSILVSVSVNQPSTSCWNNDEILRQRNMLSRSLNRAKEEHGRLQCLHMNITDSGGWCIRNNSNYPATPHMFDAKMAKALSSFLKGKTVASFGDGPGHYRDYILNLGDVNRYDGYDGAPFSSVNTNNSIQFLDLTINQYGLPAYDWVVCLEVIEHIPAKYELNVLSNIARHAREGIVMSWADEGQPGHSHVNCRNQKYVLKAMGELGFKRDKGASSALSKRAKFKWLKANTNIYRRKRDVPLLEQDL